LKHLGVGVFIAAASLASIAPAPAVAEAGRFAAIQA
jgi:hypothetical protein